MTRLTEAFIVLIMIKQTLLIFENDFIWTFKDILTQTSKY